MTDKTKPWDGMPQNPERDGWHWLQCNNEAPEANYWRALNREFHGLDGMAITANPAWRYLGPCLTPAEVTAMVEDARRDAFAECAAMLGVYTAESSTGWFERLHAAIGARGEGGEGG